MSSSLSSSFITFLEQQNPYGKGEHIKEIVRLAKRFEDVLTQKVPRSRFDHQPYLVNVYRDTGAYLEEVKKAKPRQLHKFKETHKLANLDKVLFHRIKHIFFKKSTKDLTLAEWVTARDQRRITLKAMASASAHTREGDILNDKLSAHHPLTTHRWSSDPVTIDGVVHPQSHLMSSPPSETDLNPGGKVERFLQEIKDSADWKEECFSPDVFCEIMRKITDNINYMGLPNKVEAANILLTLSNPNRVELSQAVECVTRVERISYDSALLGKMVYIDKYIIPVTDVLTEMLK